MLLEIGYAINCGGSLLAVVGSLLNAKGTADERHDFHEWANKIWFVNSCMLAVFFAGVYLNIFILNGSAIVNVFMYLVFAACNAYALQLDKLIVSLRKRRLDGMVGHLGIPSLKKRL